MIFLLYPVRITFFPYQIEYPSIRLEHSFLIPLDLLLQFNYWCIISCYKLIGFPMTNDVNEPAETEVACSAGCVSKYLHKYYIY